jgi:glucose-6-phosphate isomerase
MSTEFLTQAPDSMASEQRYRQAMDAVRHLTEQARQRRIVDLFCTGSERMRHFSLAADTIHLDISKQNIGSSDLRALIDLAEAAEVTLRRDAQFRGDPVNLTENRAVLHTALRYPEGKALAVQGEDLMPQIHSTRSRMRDFCNAVRAGDWRGARGHRITDVVSIGIGGSQLGPVLACQALRDWSAGAPKIHFLANIDPGSWQNMRQNLNPDSTLVIIASKSWTTNETARNARVVRQWLLDHGITQSGLTRHLVAVTANLQGAQETGLSEETIFPFWDWVGGRFSMWSAIGLPIMLSVGADAFEQMLGGAHAMDEHFVQAPLPQNAPVLMALVSLWNRLLLPDASEAVIPYCDALARLPAYLQQQQMESNGKSVDLDGRPLRLKSSPVVWGEPGNDAQHSFFQALHQGTSAHPVEFVLTIPPESDSQDRDLSLMANALAQAQTLMLGRDLQSSHSALVESGHDEASALRLAPHLVHPGNRPSTTLLLEQLTPRSFGALIALYEHKTSVLGWLWRINSFDQWGVELGKQSAARIEAQLALGRPVDADLDASTADLIAKIKARLAVR